ncbi:MAG: NAD-binding protein [Alicyclobacillus sp.]|nr:NAD-binding protein [Alicyclobacillus sp.]
MFVLFAKLLQTIARRTEVYLTVTALVCIVVGAALFAHYEHLTFFESLYWSIVTAATVGYGDISPHTNAGRAITIGVIVTCVPLFGAVFSMIAARIAEAKIRRLVGMESPGFWKDHIVVLGDSDETSTVIDALRATGRIVLVSEKIDPATLPAGVSHIKGDPRDPNVVAKTRPGAARHAVITGERDGDILETAIALREVAKDLPVTVSTRSARASRALQALGIHRTLVWQELLGHTLAKSLQAPHAGSLLLQMVNSDEFVIQEVPVSPEMVGQSFKAVRAAHPDYVLGMAQNEEIFFGVRKNPLVQPGATLLVLKPQV